MEEKLDTFPRLLMHHAKERPDHPATREKDLGIWQTWTWRQVADEVRSLACGLAAQGFQGGMHLAIVGDNRPRLYWAMLAAQCLGGIPVPMYQDAQAAEFTFVLQDAEIAFAIVEDQEQVDKMIEAQPKVPSLHHIYYNDPRGLRNYEGVPVSSSCRKSGANTTGRIRDFSRNRSRRGKPTTIDHALHIGHDGQAQGRVSDAQCVHYRCARRLSNSTTSVPATRSSPTCRWHGSATICSRLRNGSSPASPSTAPNPATR